MTSNKFYWCLFCAANNVFDCKNCSETICVMYGYTLRIVFNGIPAGFIYSYTVNGDDIYTGILPTTMVKYIADKMEKWREKHYFIFMG